jgi:hypothetical protein
MHTLSGRTTALIGAVVALVLLTMQLRAEGASGYDMGDVLSILVAVLPVLFHGARATVPRRASRVADADGGDGPASPDPDHHTAPPVDDGSRSVLRWLLATWGAWLLAGVSWMLTVGLVVLQAWPAALSSLIIFLVAASAIAPSSTAERAPTTTGGGPDRR